MTGKGVLWCRIAVAAAAVWVAPAVAVESSALLTPAGAAVCRLMERTQEYHRLIRKGSIKRLSKLRSPEAPEIGTGEARYLRDLLKGLKNYRARVMEVKMHGDQARVHVQVTGKYRKGSVQWDLNQEMDWYWVFQAGDWYRLPSRPTGWKPGKGISIPLPAEHECP